MVAAGCVLLLTLFTSFGYVDFLVSGLVGTVLFAVFLLVELALLLIFSGTLVWDICGFRRREQ